MYHIKYQEQKNYFSLMINLLDKGKKYNHRKIEYCIKKRKNKPLLLILFYNFLDPYE